MRERAHRKGEVFQSWSKDWLLGRSLLGFTADHFGDAYDVTGIAATIGEVAFDYSLKLNRDGETNRIAYIECKYRSLPAADIDAQFLNFLERVFDALADEEGELAETAEFMFISNIPPGPWRDFVSNKVEFICQELDREGIGPASEIVQRMATSVHVLVLELKLIRRV